MELVHLGDPTACGCGRRKDFTTAAEAFNLIWECIGPHRWSFFSHCQLSAPILGRAWLAVGTFTTPLGTSSFLSCVGTVLVNTGRNEQGWPGRERKGVAAAADFDGLNWL